ncbi:MAG: glycosyltransferase family 2 protein [Gammaproteobacteria bacterium]|nr:glycosyltransferase family 2 protein [Gammaproteobacteria bacterium]
MTPFIHMALALVALPVTVSSAYLLFLTLLSGSTKTPEPSTRSLRFDVIVPAHDEASVISHTVANLKTLDWPPDRFRIVVIADNCTDETADLARSGGAEVLERHDLTRRGKGYALEHAFAASRTAGWADAVVVIDADAEVSANLLEAFAARLERGESAVQAHYGVLNPFASWRTRLITIAKAAFHIVRSRARERVGLSCGIRGNGWCVTHRLLTQVPYRAFSLTEDLEYGVDLGLAGFRVAYADEAHSNADMASNEQVASKQRQRWESGRFQLIRAKTIPLLIAAARRRSLTCLDLAMDLMVLPLSYVVLNAFGLIALAGIFYFVNPRFEIWLWIGCANAAVLMIYVLRGWRLSGIGLQGLADLGRAPGFLAWKVLLMFNRRKSTEWVRTERER